MTMRVLLADDDAVSRRVLAASVAEMGHEVVVIEDGTSAWALLEAERFDMLISDWIMPGVDGMELCRRMRSRVGKPFTYVMLVTQRGSTQDVVRGIMAGAHDFMKKPVERAELHARLHSAERMVGLERSLAGHIRDLQGALDEVRTLRRLLPICMYCKSIRNDQQVWDEIEAYFHEHANTDFTHSICPTCYDGRVLPMLDELRRQAKVG